MRRTMISALILFALVCSCYCLEPIVISQERGMAVLAGFSDVAANQSGQNATTVNLTNQTGDSAPKNQTQTGLWSWGKIPAGYQLNENGTLTRLADQQWKPSI